MQPNHTHLQPHGLEKPNTVERVQYLQSSEESLRALVPRRGIEPRSPSHQPQLQQKPLLEYKKEKKVAKFTKLAFKLSTIVWY